MKKTCKIYGLVYLICVCFLLIGCQTTKQRLLDTDQSQVEMRSIQTRAFDTTDKKTTLRTIIATLQDLEFLVDKADHTLGVVSATKLKGYFLKMTVSVRQRGNTQLLVRANAQYGIEPVTDPTPYQQFFSALEKSMFLTAHQVD
jgi:starvation-inducible outer membrane lipoprotein|tara:strand:- start:2658 stop:3089 length:432 start_codon:yes stop_codon:yes gene_type:complete